MQHQLTMSSLPDLLAICKLNSRHKIPNWALQGQFSAMTRTADELSIVCQQAYVPPGIIAERDWRGLKIEGPLDFSFIGILAEIATILATAKISLFAISTYETDYILVRAENFRQACQALRQAGHHIHGE